MLNRSYILMALTRHETQKGKFYLSVNLVSYYTLMRQSIKDSNE